MYTVKEMSELSGVTVKTLHHYHKLGLLIPARIADNGYRYYSENEVNRLQEILFYRNLDFSLKEIRSLLENNRSRLEILEEQRNMLQVKKQKLDIILDTLIKSIEFEKGVVSVSAEEKFIGIEIKEQDGGSIYQTMSNMTVIFVNPYLLYMAITFGFLTIIFIICLFNGNRIGGMDWMLQFREPQKIIMVNWLMIIMCAFGSIGSIVSIWINKRNKVKTLNAVNQPYKKLDITGEKLLKLPVFEYHFFDIKNKKTGIKFGSEEFLCRLENDRLVLQDKTGLVFSEEFVIFYKDIEKFELGIAREYGMQLFEIYYCVNTIITKSQKIEIRNGNIKNTLLFKEFVEKRELEVVDELDLLSIAEFESRDVRYEKMAAKYKESLEKK